VPRIPPDLFGLAAFRPAISVRELMLRIPSYCLAIIALTILFPSFALPQGSRRTSTMAQSTAAIRAVLDAQRDAWNRGDIEGYMDGYERSKDTVFISGDSVTRGWQTVLERYRKNYDTREKMGVLTFSDLEINLLNGTSAVVLGRWMLKRSNDEPHGRFTLIFKRTKKGWRIVHDHTS
jgi:ketosteroid isomerase-like protein